MRSSRHPSRLGTAALLSALALSLVAAPSSAAGKVRVVDNDGKGSATNCDATTKTFSKIQKAVDASAAGDIVKVCPGTYKERVSITGARDGLQLVTTKALGATIKDPDVYAYPTPPLVRIDGVDNVLVRGFKVRTLSYQSYMAKTMDGIVANNALGVKIRGNHLSWISKGDGDRTNLINGIVAMGGTTGTISGNTVVDAWETAILARDAGTNVTIKGNTVDAKMTASQIEAQRGIGVILSAKAVVDGNTVTSVAVPSTSFSELGVGIELNGSSPSTVKNNTVKGVTTGIRVWGADGTVLDNKVNSRQTAINIRSNADNGEIARNTAKASGATYSSIRVSADSDKNNIHDNIANGSAGIDCVDEGGTPLGNTWTNNAGDQADPAPICGAIIEPPH